MNRSFKKYLRNKIFLIVILNKFQEALNFLPLPSLISKRCGDVAAVLWTELNLSLGVPKEPGFKDDFVVGFFAHRA